MWINSGILKGVWQRLLSSLFTLVAPCSPWKGTRRDDAALLSIVSDLYPHEDSGDGAKYCILARNYTPGHPQTIQVVANCCCNPKHWKQVINGANHRKSKHCDPDYFFFTTTAATGSSPGPVGPFFRCLNAWSQSPPVKKPAYINR